MSSVATQTLEADADAAAATPPLQSIPLTRTLVAAQIRAALKRRSGKSWSVTAGTGTAYGWLHIDAPPARRNYQWDGATPVPAGEWGFSSLADRSELAQLLRLEAPVHAQGESVPSGLDYYQEYLDRAEGRQPCVYGVPSWD